MRRPHRRALGPGVFADLQARIDERVRAGESIIPLHIGDTYLEPTKAAQAELREVALSDFAYGPTAGTAGLRLAITEKLARALPGAHVDPTCEVLVGAGGTHAFFCVANALLGEGDEVIVAAPYWPLTPGVFAATGCTIREVVITSEWLQGREVDLEVVLGAALTPKTRAIYFASPNNPDGKVWSADSLERLAAFAERHDLWVFADEVYADLVYEGAHVSARAIAKLHDRLIVIHSLSKSHALAGMRLGFVVAPKDVVDAARRVSVHTAFNVPTLLQRVGSSALRTGEPWIDAARETYRDARGVALAELRRHEIPAVSGEGATYCFVDATSALDGRPLKVLLERALDEGVLVTPGDASGSAFAGWARICFTSCRVPQLTAGIEALSRAYRSL